MPGLSPQDTGLYDETKFLKYEWDPMRISSPIKEEEMMKIENDNMRNNWQKAVQHTKFQEDKLARVVKSPIRNKPFCKDSMVHLFEAIQNIEHDQQLGDSKGVDSILSFGFMSCINHYFKTISMFSLVLYDLSNKKYLRFICKPSVLANTIFIDDVRWDPHPGFGGSLAVRDPAALHELTDQSTSDSVLSRLVDDTEHAELGETIRRRSVSVLPAVPEHQSAQTLLRSRRQQLHLPVLTLVAQTDGR